MLKPAPYKAMAEDCKHISSEILRLLDTINLKSLGPKLEALGVRQVSDLALVDDADLVRWGCSTIERRRFFAHMREVLGEPGADDAPDTLTSIKGSIKGKTVAYDLSCKKGALVERMRMQPPKRLTLRGQSSHQKKGTSSR